MSKLSARSQKWLKCFHIFFACLWIGGVLALTLMGFFMKANDGMQLYGIDLSKKFIDDFVIIPGGNGLLLTALLYSIFTNWGWFKHKWITTKWAINLYGVVAGTFWLGPWLNASPPISKMKGLAALSDGIYMHNQKMLNIWGSFQLATILFALYLSVLKPWKKRL